MAFFTGKRARFPCIARPRRHKKRPPDATGIGQPAKPPKHEKSGYEITTLLTSHSLIRSADRLVSANSPVANILFIIQFRKHRPGRMNAHWPVPPGKPGSMAKKPYCCLTAPLSSMIKGLACVPAMQCDSNRSKESCGRTRYRNALSYNNVKNPPKWLHYITPHIQNESFRGQMRDHRQARCGS